MRWLFVPLALSAGCFIKPDPPSDASCAATIPNLVGWWKLDDGAGTTAVDAIARHSGMLLGGATWAEGYASGAVAFDGVDGRIDIDDGGIPYATAAAPFSFSAWFDLTDYSTMVPDIMQMRSDSMSPFHVLISNMSGFDGISTGAGDGTWATIKTEREPSPGVWHHVAVTYNGLGAATIGNFQIFLDGMSQPLVAADAYASQAQGSRIGAAESPANQWIGLIDDVRIYDRAITEAEVGQLASICP